MKMLNHTVVMLAMICPTTFCYAADKVATNLFPGSTFDTFDGDMPAGWKEETWNENIMRIETRQSQPGRDGTGSCLELAPTTPLTATTLTSPAMPVSSNRPYLLKGYYTSDSPLLIVRKRWTDAEGISMKGNWLDAEGTPISSFTLVLPDTQDRWVEFFREEQSPEGAEQLQIVITRRWLGGRLRFDDFSLREGTIMDFVKEFSLPQIPNDELFPIYAWIAPFRGVLHNAHPGRHKFSVGTESQLIAEYSLCNFTVGTGEFGTMENTGVGEDDEELRAKGEDPNVWGFIGTDEPPETDFPKLAKINERIKRLSPDKPFCVNLFPTYNFASLEEYEHHVEAFIDVVKPKIFTYDHYCLVGADPKTHAESWFSPNREGDYFANLEIVRDRVLQAGIDFGVILGVGFFGPVRGASDAELRWQAFTTLAYGSRALGWFTYLTEGNYGHWTNWADNVINRDGTRTRHYAMLKYINGEVLAWGPTLLKLRSTGVYHSNPTPKRTQSVDKSPLVKSVDGGMALIGEFESTDGDTCMMVVNRDFIEGASFQLQLRKKARGIAKLSRQTGEWEKFEDYDPTTGTLSLPLDAGNAELLRLE